MEVSIIWTEPSWVSAKASVIKSQMPAIRQRTNRLWQVVQGPKLSGRSHHGAPDRNIQKDAVEDTSVVDPKHAARLVRKERLMAVHSKSVEAEF